MTTQLFLINYRIYEIIDITISPYLTMLTTTDNNVEKYVIRDRTIYGLDDCGFESSDIINYITYINTGLIVDFNPELYTYMGHDETDPDILRIHWLRSPNNCHDEYNCLKVDHSFYDEDDEYIDLQEYIPTKFIITNRGLLYSHDNIEDYIRESFNIIGETGDYIIFRRNYDNIRTKLIKKRYTTYSQFIYDTGCEYIIDEMLRCYRK